MTLHTSTVKDTHQLGTSSSSVVIPSNTFSSSTTDKSPLWFVLFSTFYWFLPYFPHQGGVGLSCCRMLIELIRDNRKIVDRITPTQVTTYLFQLQDNKHYVLLNLLGVLCVCDGIAITNNQVQISKELLERHKVCQFFQLKIWQQFKHVQIFSKKCYLAS